MRIGAVLIVCLLSGCPRPRAVVHPPAAGACSTAMALPGADDVCDGMFTRAGLACVRCAERNCVDRVDAVYCLNGASCTADPACLRVEALDSRSMK